MWSRRDGSSIGLSGYVESESFLLKTTPHCTTRVVHLASRPWNQSSVGSSSRRNLSLSLCGGRRRRSVSELKAISAPRVLTQTQRPPPLEASNNSQWIWIDTKNAWRTSLRLSFVKTKKYVKCKTTLLPCSQCSSTMDSRSSSTTTRRIQRLPNWSLKTHTHIFHRFLTVEWNTQLVNMFLVVQVTKSSLRCPGDAKCQTTIVPLWVLHLSFAGLSLGRHLSFHSALFLLDPLFVLLLCVPRKSKL